MRAIVQILLLVITMAFNIPQERRVDETFKIQKNENLSLDFRFADQIKITTWDKNEVNVKVLVNINENENNDAFELTSVKKSRGIEIISEIANLKKLANKNHIIEISEDGDTIINGCNLKMDLYFDVKIPKNIDLDVSTISGDVIVTEFRGDSRIKTISGYVDYSIQEKDKAEIELKTISGDIYTNLELEIEREEHGMNHLFGGEVHASLNGGGREIKLETISNNIFLRKSK